MPVMNPEVGSFKMKITRYRTKVHFLGHDALLDFDKAGSIAITAFSLLEISCWDCVGKRAGNLNHGWYSAYVAAIL
jgi:hypothetical protein